MNDELWVVVELHHKGTGAPEVTVYGPFDGKKSAKTFAETEKVNWPDNDFYAAPIDEPIAV